MNIDALNEYLNEIKTKPFKWGEHDCLIFTNEAWRRLYGYPWAPEFLGEYMDGERILRRDEIKAKLLEISGKDTFIKAVDDKLQRYNGIPPRGALLLSKAAGRWVIGGALGICVGTHGAFISWSGVVYLPLSDTDKAWVE